MATPRAQQQTTETSGPARTFGFDGRTPFAVLEREHQSLRQGLSRLRQAVAADHATTADLCDQIEAVRRSLAVHFAFEENFGSIHYLRAWPSLQPQVDELSEEHREILATLDRLAAGLGTTQSPADVQAAMASLIERLADHALKQNGLRRSALRAEPSRSARQSAADLSARRAL